MYKPGDLCFPHVLLVLSDINSFRSAYTVICFTAIYLCGWKCHHAGVPVEMSLIVSAI